MSRYLAAAPSQIVVTLVLMSFVVYLLIGLMPGDPIDMMIAGDPKMTSEDAARLRARLRRRQAADRALPRLGAARRCTAISATRARFNQPVLAVLWPRLLNTLELAGLAFVLATAIALPLGIWAAARPRSRADYLVNLFCFAGISTPTFWLALLLISLFAVKLGWLPAGGMADPRAGTPWPAALGQNIALRRSCRWPRSTLVQLGVYTRFMRGAMIEALRQDYVRTARAKGASERARADGPRLRQRAGAGADDPRPLLRRRCSRAR